MFKIGTSRKSGRLSNITEVTNIQQMKGFLVTMAVKKAFESLDYRFFISVLKKFGFGRNFISWIEVILKNQESSVFKGGTTAKYFKLNRGARQSDPISAYYSFWSLKLYFSLLKKNPV